VSSRRRFPRAAIDAPGEGPPLLVGQDVAVIARSSKTRGMRYSRSSRTRASCAARPGFLQFPIRWIRSLAISLADMLSHERERIELRRTRTMPRRQRRCRVASSYSREAQSLGLDALGCTGARSRRTSFASREPGGTTDTSYSDGRRPGSCRGKQLEGPRFGAPVGPQMLRQEEMVRAARAKGFIYRCFSVVAPGLEPGASCM
jgi:hypothetical protein